jgi:hypothetical protein
MKSNERLREVRLFLGAGTVAMLLGVWSALTVHDLQASKNTAAAAPSSAVTTTTANTSPAPRTSVPSRTTTTIRPVPHTRTHAS